MVFVEISINKPKKKAKVISNQFGVLKGKISINAKYINGLIPSVLTSMLFKITI